MKVVTAVVEHAPWGSHGFHTQVAIMLVMMNGLYAVIWANAVRRQVNAFVILDILDQHVNIVSA